MENDLTIELGLQCLGSTGELRYLFGKRDPRRCHSIFYLLCPHYIHDFLELIKDLAKFFNDFLELGLNSHQPGGLIAGF
jgi:hypothetical protein